MTDRKRVFSGIQPTAVMTIGNYFGAVKNWVDLQDECEGIYCVVDLHAMTRSYQAEELRQASKDMFVSLLAAGLDTERSTVFVQSTVPEHTELCWVLATLTSLGDLSRMTQFKEKSGQVSVEGGDDGEFVSSGLLFYPVLQAADILAYRAHYVPVGQDQAQHLELARGLARRFNSRFGEVFPEPETLTTKVPKVLSTADPTKKMSKSLGPKHYIGLFEDEASIRQKIKSAVTDSGDTPEGEVSPGIGNLLTLLEACGREGTAEAMRADYLAGTLRYVDLKGETADALVELTRSMKDRREQVLHQETQLESRIFEMAAKARTMAAETLTLVRERAGFQIPLG